MSELINQSVDGSVLHIGINRPEKKNALTGAMYSQLAEIIENQVGDISAVILSGGSDFTAGNDLADFLQNPPGEGNAPVYQFMCALSGCPIPVIAAVDGVAVGIGTTLLLHCDFVFATPQTMFVMPFIDLSVVPEYASSMLLPQRVGYVKAAEMLLLGERFDATTALEYGLINRICESENLLATASDTARKLAEKSRPALIKSKALMRREPEPLMDRIAVENQSFAEMIASPEARAAISALLKR